MTDEPDNEPRPWVAALVGWLGILAVVAAAVIQLNRYLSPLFR